MVRGNADVRRYMREVRKLIPGPRKIRRAIISKIEATVIDFLSDNPGAAYEALVIRFGSPKQIASAYVGEMEDFELLSKLSIKRKCISILVVLAAVIVGVWVGVVGIALADHFDQVNGYYNVYIDEEYDLPIETGGK